jgi:excisionase family DNA binding protein
MTDDFQPRYLSVRNAAKRYGTSTSTMYVVIKQKKVRAVKFNGRTLVQVASGDAYFDGLPEVKLASPKPGMGSTV